MFEALFARSSFLAGNPVARTMENMLAVLDAHAVGAENETLEGFYDTVRKRVTGVDNAAGKQRVLVELYDKFFATAFPKTVAKLGIVYTPVEIVDFILRSADEVPRAEFGQGLTDEGVHVLDPFTGTGTFLVRLLQSGLIEAHDLARKYANELHANEILLLAYYIAAANIETTYEELEGTPSPFPGLVLTDSFQSWEDDDQQDIDVMPENNERLERQKKLPIQVIVGNPPYSADQDSANDDNANEKYPTLDAAIRDTYAARSTATNKNSLYDSYIRAIKWATLRIKDRGLVAFVTNGGFLDSNTADGMRKTLAEEFAAIHVFNLRGNQRSAKWRAEGGKIFGGGSQATVAITLLVERPGDTGYGTIHYTDVGAEPPALDPDQFHRPGHRQVESQRQVSKLFLDTLPEIAARRPHTVVIIDEVEALAVRRSTAFFGPGEGLDVWVVPGDEFCVVTLDTGGQVLWTDQSIRPIAEEPCRVGD